MDYADTITAERVKHVIQGYGEGKKAVEGTGGSFDFYELGETIFDPTTGNLNDNADTEQIRRYIWFSETNTPYPTTDGDAMNRISTYTFEARTTDYASRFRLVFSICEDANGDSAFAFISNGNIIVNGEGTLQVIDMTGRVVVCTDAARNVSTDGMTSGVYVLRLINGDNVKTQKIVVR